MATKSILSTAWLAIGNKMGTILKNKNKLNHTNTYIHTSYGFLLVPDWLKKNLQKQFIYH